MKNQDNDIDIVNYEPRMIDQVTDLFCDQYGVDFDAFKTHMLRFYDDDYQVDRCIRVVAVREEKVVGFQSFFYWPMTMDGKRLESFQSGNSIVAASERGKGVFQRLLNFIYDHQETYKYELLLGFPVEASIRSFKRNGWENILNLQWHFSPVNPAGVLFPKRMRSKRFKKRFQTDAPENTLPVSSNSICLESSKEFVQWRRGFQEHEIYWTEVKVSDCSIWFEVKFSKRSKWINECTIGRIKTSAPCDPAHLAKATRVLRNRLLSHTPFVTLLTIAINENSQPFAAFAKALKSTFRKSSKEIYFILKHSNNSALENPAAWELYRSDIDTW